MAENVVQVVVVVNLYADVPDERLLQLLPAERLRVDVLRLTEFGAQKLERPPYTKPVDWHTMGKAIEKIGIRVHEIQEQARPYAMDLYVIGQGPLAAFVHLGSLFTKSVQNVTVFNLPDVSGDAWEPFPMGGAPTNSFTQDILDKIVGFPDEPSPTTGRVGFVVDSGRRSQRDSEPTEVYEKFITDQKEPVGNIVQLRSYDEKFVITDFKMPAIVRQFAQRMSSMPHLFPKRSGLALFVGGPTQIAFAIGRSINANVLVGDVLLTEYIPSKNEYEKVYALPFVANTAVEIPRGAAAVRARDEVLHRMVDAFTELQKQVEPRHLPSGILNETDKENFVKRLRKIRILHEHDGVEGQPFRLRVLQAQCQLGEGILEALVSSTAQQQKDFAKLLLLHEIVHDWQILRNTNHPNIGKAGFVLEHIDYLADVFAVRVLVNLELDRGGADAQENIQKRVLYWLDMVLHGIAAFDQAEQGKEKIDRLAERRLRRYLLWHVQRARASTIETSKQFDCMMESALTVEMAPLTGWVDAERWEKMVRDTLPDTELCIAIDGKLIREDRRSGFEPDVLFEAIRTYAHEKARNQVYAVVDQHRTFLVPWTLET